MKALLYKLTTSPEGVDRALGRTALCLAAALPLVTLGITKILAKEHPSSLTQSISKVGDDPRLQQFCRNNMKSNRAFVLFKNGTCVVVENEYSADDIREKALQLLSQSAKPGVKFICSAIEDDNLIVSYSEPVFHLRFQDEIAKHHTSIQMDFERFLTEEELAEIPNNWEPPFHAKVGLRSRARLLKDGADPVICQIIAPKGTKKSRDSREIDLHNTASLSK